MTFFSPSSLSWYLNCNGALLADCKTGIVLQHGKFDQLEGNVSRVKTLLAIIQASLIDGIVNKKRLNTAVF